MRLVLFILLWACVTAGAGAAERSVWTHNGSLVYLVADGAERTFRYIEPRAGLVEAGAARDAVLFAGRVEGRRYVGSATLFRPNCGTFTYPVSGTIRNDDRQVVLKGEAPRIGPDCRPQGTRTDTLSFDYVGLRDVDAAPAAASFPPAFRGYWQLARPTGGACPRPRLSLTSGVIQIGATSWKGWESGCDLVRIDVAATPSADGQVTLRVEMACFVEATSYKSREVWQLRQVAGRPLLVGATIKTWDHRDESGATLPNDDEPGIDVYTKCDP
ncbi:hypothetical protein CCR97_11995 [Rhodoplanes elegans]|uniref:Uncharacterized protein n=1 Tax=Rhodoplanes elegans TaxID=29408 RepID=A0A327KC65_9BRAD|nr:hypothetical protein [Rhodoplanes elegans]MBK5958924.1 hypothetical protein [Rhodoplanes elegans]RAI35731.1 hypothetical protein CH338_18755 [Rhodoplanes elegans]